jgi:hypothetical protein
VEVSEMYCVLSHCSTPRDCRFYCDGELSTPPLPVGSSNCLTK